MRVRTKAVVFLGFFLVISGIFLISCKKDQLTILSISPPPNPEDTTDTCHVYWFNIDLDSAAVPPGTLPRLIEVCTCDTVYVYIDSIPAGFNFYSWFINDIYNPEAVASDTFCLTDTINSIWVQFQDSSNSFIYPGMELDFQPCN